MRLWPNFMRITILIGRMRMTGPGWHRTGNKWDGMRETMETEMETFSKKASDEAGELSRQVRIENREQYDYREFLRKFSVMRETVQIDTDAFDYIYYDYGLRTYGNMPLI